MRELKQQVNIKLRASDLAALTRLAVAEDLRTATLGRVIIKKWLRRRERAQREQIGAQA